MKIRRITYPTGREKWLLDLGKVGGKRKTEVYDTRDKALAALDAAVARRERAGALGLSLTPERVAAYAMAEQRLAEAGGTIERAVELFLRVGAAVRERVKLSELIERCGAHKLATGRRPRSVATLKSAPLALSRALGDPWAETVGQDDVANWLDAQPFAPKTRNNVLSELRAIYAWGRGRGLVAHDPTEGIDRAKVELGEIDWLRPAEVRLLMLATPPGLVAFHALALWAGIRPEEILRMGWDDIDLADAIAIVRSDAAKGRQRRVVHLEPAAVEWLMSAPKERLCPTAHASRLFEMLRESRAAIKRPWPHDACRHTYATMHYAKHRDAARLQAEMGHRSADLLHRHYRGLATRAQAEEFWAITPGSLSGEGKIIALA